MANQHQRPGQSPAQQPPRAPSQPPAAREDDAADERDDVDEIDAAPARPSARAEEESLLAAAKRKLGLADDASPMEILRAIAGMATPGYAGPARAACKLRLSVDGRRVVLAPGDLIPEGVDVAKLPPHAVEGR